MQVEIDKACLVTRSAEVTWEFLQNIAAVAGCAPWSQISDRFDAGSAALAAGVAAASAADAELNVLELTWSICRDRLRGLFSRNTK